MALFCAAIQGDSVSLLNYLLLSHIQVILCEISPNLSPCSCFCSHFLFSRFCCPWLQQLVFPCLVFAYSSTLRIIASSVPASLLSSFLDTCCLLMSFLWCKALCIVLNFIVLWFIFLNYSFIHFKNWSRVSYKRDYPGIFPFILPNLIFRSCLFLLGNSFLIFPLISESVYFQYS